MADRSRSLDSARDKALDSALWLDAKQLAAREGITERSARRKYLGLTANLNGTRDLYVRRVASLKGGGAGGTRIEFCVSALERDGLLELPTSNLQPPETQLVVAKDVILEKPLLPATQNPQPSLFAPSAASRVALPDDQTRQADERLAAIQPILDFRARPKDAPALILRGGARIGNQDDLVRWLARQQGTPARTLYRWLDRWDHPEKFGATNPWVALANRVRRDKGTSKLFGAPPARLPDDEAGIARELAKLTPAGRFLAGLCIKGRANARDAWERLCRDHRAHGLDSAPSYSAVAGFVAAFPPPLRSLAHLPEKAWNDRHRPYAVRDYRTARVLEWWVLDHGQDDYFVYNDWIEALDRFAFPDHPPNAWLRMWLTAIEDVRSRFLVGYAFAATPSSNSICSAIRMAVSRTGRAPRFGLIDRGKDFLKVGKPGLTEAQAGAFIRLIRHEWGEDGRIVPAIGENPQSKPVEPWFKLKRSRFDSQATTWGGANCEERLDHVQPLLDEHEAWQKGRAASTSLPAASLAIQATAWWIENWYNARHQHSGHAMNGRTPAEVLYAACPADEMEKRRAALDRRWLEEFLWHRTERKVFNEGCVRLFNAEYDPADPPSLAALRCHDGRAVQVACDPYNLGDAVAFDESGVRIGALLSKQLLAWGASADKIKAHLRGRTKFRRATAAYVAGLPLVHGPEPFAFLGAKLQQAQPALATGTTGRALNAGPAAPLPDSPFVDDAAAALRRAFEEED